MCPAAPAGGKKAPHKSWYLRAEDEGSFETWRWALAQAGVPPADRAADVVSAELAPPDVATDAAGAIDAPRGRSMPTVHM